MEEHAEQRVSHRPAMSSQPSMLSLLFPPLSAGQSSSSSDECHEESRSDIQQPNLNERTSSSNRFNFTDNAFGTPVGLQTNDQTVFGSNALNLHDQHQVQQFQPVSPNLTYWGSMTPHTVLPSDMFYPISHSPQTVLPLGMFYPPISHSTLSPNGGNVYASMNGQQHTSLASLSTTLLPSMSQFPTKKPDGNCQTPNCGSAIVLSVRTKNGIISHVCKTCAQLIETKGSSYHCYGCGKSLMTYSGWTRPDRHQPKTQKQCERAYSVQRSNESTESTENDHSHEDSLQPPKKKPKVDTQTKPTVDFLRDYDSFFSFDYKKIQFYEQEKEHRIAVLYFAKGSYVNFTPKYSNHISLKLIEIYPGKSKILELSGCNTSLSIEDCDWFAMRFKIPSWIPEEGQNFVKVNIVLNISEKKITSHTGSLCFPEPIHGEEHRVTSDILFTNSTMRASAEPVDSSNNPDLEDMTPQQKRIELMGVSERKERNDWIFFDTEKEIMGNWITKVTRLSDLDPCGYSPIDYCICHFDTRGLEYILQSDHFDLNTKSKLGYTQEFWCYYFNNMKALEMIQDAKIRKMTLSRLYDQDSIILKIFSFVNCGFTLNFALHEKRIYSYLSKIDSKRNNPYKTMFGRFKSGKIHMLYSDQPIIGRSASVSVAGLNDIEKVHTLIDFGLKQCVIHLVCSEASSKIIIWFKTDANMNEMVRNMKVIGCEYGYEQCKTHKDMSQSVKCDLGSHPILNLGDLGTSVKILQFVGSKDCDVKCFGRASENLTHAILGPRIHVADSFDIAQFITLCATVEHLELKDITYQDEETIYFFWEVIGNAPNLKKISLHLTSQEFMYEAHIYGIVCNCPVVEYLNVATQDGTHVVNQLVKQYRSARILKGIHLEYESCDEEAVNIFMLLYGNICNVVLTELHRRMDNNDKANTMIGARGLSIISYPSSKEMNNHIVMHGEQSNSIVSLDTRTQFREDKKLILRALRQDGSSLMYASDELRNDKEFILKVIKKDGSLLQYASSKMKNDKEVVLRALRQDGSSLMYASDELRNDKEFILKVIKKDGSLLQYASSEMKMDKEVVLQAIQNSISNYHRLGAKYERSVIQHVPEILRNDRDVMLLAIQQDGSSLMYASDELKKDREVVLQAIEKGSSPLMFASNELKNDKEFILQAIKKQDTSLMYASSVLKRDKEFILQTIKQSGSCIQYASHMLQVDKEFILQAIQTQASSLHFVLDKWKNDREVVVQAAKLGVSLSQLVSGKFKNDKDIMLQVLKEDSSFLQDLSEELRNDKDIILQAVKTKSSSLKYASHALKNDKEIILQAIKTRGSSLMYASDELKNDKEVVLQALKQDGSSLMYASDELKNDKEVVLQALKQDGSSLMYASDKLKNDKEFVWQAIKQRGYHFSGHQTN